MQIGICFGRMLAISPDDKRAENAYFALSRKQCVITFVRVVTKPLD